MKLVVQRVSSASVEVAGETVGAVDGGLLVLVGVGREDCAGDARYLAGRTARLRIFRDPEGKMNLSVADVGGAVLAISQFTLYADTRKGNRPGFAAAMPPDEAEPLYEAYVAALREAGLRVETGRFGAKMAVSLVNDGPVTVLLESTGRA